MPVLASNNASSTLATSAAAGDTTLNLQPGTGSKYPAASSANGWFYATLANTSGAVEIVKVTGRSTDTLTVLRGVDGTTALAWNAGDKVELRPVAALFNDKADRNDANTFTGAQTFQANAYFATSIVSSGGMIELGSQTATSTPFVDFHSSGSANDYDARIIASGGTSGTVGAGTLTYTAATHVLSGAVQLAPATAPYSSSLTFKAGSYAQFVRQNSNGNLEWVNTANTAINMYLNDGGNLTVRGTVTAGGYLYAGNAQFATDGNIYGTQWGGWLSDVLVRRTGSTMSAPLMSNFGNGGSTGALRVYGDFGSSWADFAGVGNAAVQMDCPSLGSAYYGMRWTRWGDRHIAAIGGYQGGDGAPHFVVIVGNDGSPGFWFNQGGTGTYGTSWTLGSDYRIKKDVTNVDPDEALERVLKLRPVEFARIEEQHGDKRWPGYIAHEVQEQFPLVVHGKKDAMRPKMDGEPGELEVDPQSVDYIAMSIYYAGAIQSLTKKLESALVRIEQLEGAQA